MTYENILGAIVKKWKDAAVTFLCLQNSHRAGRKRLNIKHTTADIPNRARVTILGYILRSAVSMSEWLRNLLRTSESPNRGKRISAQP